MLRLAYLSLFKPPTPKDCGSPDGHLVTSPKVKLSDGRYLAYKQGGVAKEKAKHNVIIVHGFDSSKDLMLPISEFTCTCNAVETQENLAEFNL
ncbi:hypothetical protein KY284_029961 [Solanum tuberosum]|nr:hypothetical protein KY284_029961 [Solanum tuberosum]